MADELFFWQFLLLKDIVLHFIFLEKYDEDLASYCSVNIEGINDHVNVIGNQVRCVRMNFCQRWVSSTYAFFVPISTVKI